MEDCLKNISQAVRPKQKFQAHLQFSKMCNYSVLKSGRPLFYDSMIFSVCVINTPQNQRPMLIFKGKLVAIDQLKCDIQIN